MNHIKNLKETKYGMQGEVFFGLFDKFINLTVKEDSTAEFAEQCAELLNRLNEEVIDRLCRASELYCNDFLDAIGKPPIHFETSRAVLEKIRPGALIVPPPDDNNTPVIWMEHNCEWEEEHGLEWVVRNDRVLYVGAFNGCNPYGDFKGKDSWNYAWQIN